ncbi:ATP-binding cassette domain-containing protein [Heliophilum fasciatum]|uniref:ATP-binding cassette domain-containing protein n=1 Tax=Heliophilum fasciatum TaxID=35700 RepID=UPI0014046B69|nr:ATP-binding cassette domain-containing protein [Heliophilum fasciatum]MCW2277617.1 cobalt ECF transporter T component CbiQ [Heliophilum fasciatum]
MGLTVIAGATLLGQPRALAGLLALVWALCFYRGVSWRLLVRRLLQVAPFVGFTIVLMPFWVPGPAGPVITLPWGTTVALSVEGIARAQVLALKVMISVSLLVLLWHHYGERHFFAALARLRVPLILIRLAELTLRYGQVITGEARRMERARQARGFRLHHGLTHKAIRAVYGGWLGTLFLRAMERAERVYQAMRARGYDHRAGEGQRSDSMEMSGEQRKPARMAPAVTGPTVTAPSAMALTVDQLSFAYAGAGETFTALRHVSLQVPAGAKVALLGPNGAGKSTLLHHLCGLHVPQTGTVTVLGSPVTAATVWSVRSQVGLLFQDPDDQLFCPTVWDDVAFGPQNLGLAADEVERRVRAALQAVDGLDLSARPPQRLSYGQKKRAALAGVLAMEPSVLLFDEPMAYLDPQGQGEVLAILDRLHQAGKTIILAVHDLQFAYHWADRVIILADGQVLADGGVEVLDDQALIARARLIGPSWTHR